MIERKILEQDGLYVDSSDHWEMFEKLVSIVKSGKNRGHVQITVPMDVVRHLKLKYKDKILVAIKRSK